MWCTPVWQKFVCNISWLLSFCSNECFRESINKPFHLTIGLVIVRLHSDNKAAAVIELLKAYICGHVTWESTKIKEHLPATGPTKSNGRQSISCPLAAPTEHNTWKECNCNMCSSGQKYSIGDQWIANKQDCLRMTSFVSSPRVPYESDLLSNSEKTLGLQLVQETVNIHQIWIKSRLLQKYWNLVVF